MTLEPGAVCKVKVMLEYDPELLFKLPVAVGDLTINDSNRNKGEEIAKKYSLVSNHARFASFIEDPNDPHRHTKDILGGAEVEVVTGRKTQFEYFKRQERTLTGAVIAVDNKQRVISGKVILILEVELDGKSVEEYKTLSLNNQGAFTFNLVEIKEKITGMQGYYIPRAGFSDCYSNRLTYRRARLKRTKSRGVGLEEIKPV